MSRACSSPTRRLQTASRTCHSSAVPSMGSHLSASSPTHAPTHGPLSTCSTVTIPNLPSSLLHAPFPCHTPLSHLTDPWATTWRAMWHVGVWPLPPPPPLPTPLPHPFHPSPGEHLVTQSIRTIKVSIEAENPMDEPTSRDSHQAALSEFQERCCETCDCCETCEP